MRLPTIGSRFLQRYELRKLLGQGGYGAVFLAHDTAISRDVAIKILTPDGDGTYLSGVASRFMVEAKILAQLTDPHVIRLFDYGQTDDGLLYIVSEYVDGRDLSALLAEGALPPETALDIAEQVASALAEAHDAGVLHRDIKPANILIYSTLVRASAVKLLDFGIAKVDPRDVGGGKLTRTGRVVGTPRYMAPEQLFGEALGPPMDIYALGLVLFEMLVGHPAHQGDRAEILRRAASDQPHRLPSGYSVELSALVERLTHPEPMARVQSAREARDGIRLVRQMGSAPSPLPPRPTGSASPAQTNRPGTKRAARWWWIPLIALALMSLGGFMLYVTEPEPTPTVATRRTLPSALISMPSRDAGASPSDVASRDVVVEDAIADAAELPAGPRFTFSAEGCGLEGVKPTNFGLKGFPDQTGRLFIPNNYDSNRKYPVAVVFRDMNLTAGQAVGRMGLRNGGFTFDDLVVLALEPNLQVSAVPNEPIDETIELVRAGSNLVCLDPSRVFLFGHGRGALAAHRVSCNLDVSGVLLSGWAEDPDALCQPDSAVPTVWVRQTKDMFVPRDGGVGCDGRQSISIQDQLARLKTANGCGKSSKRKVEHANCEEFQCSNAPLLSCTIEGGHYMGASTWWMSNPSCPKTIHRNETALITWDILRDKGRSLPELR